MENALFHKPQTVKFVLWHELLTIQSLSRCTRQNISFLWLNKSCTCSSKSISCNCEWTFEAVSQLSFTFSLLSLFFEQLQANYTVPYFTFVLLGVMGASRRYFWKSGQSIFVSIQLLVERSWNLIMWRAGLALLVLLVGKHPRTNELYLMVFSCRLAGDVH